MANNGARRISYAVDLSVTNAKVTKGFKRRADDELLAIAKRVRVLEAQEREASSVMNKLRSSKRSAHGTIKDEMILRGTRRVVLDGGEELGEVCLVLEKRRLGQPDASEITSGLQDLGYDDEAIEAIKQVVSKSNRFIYDMKVQVDIEDDDE